MAYRQPIAYSFADHESCGKLGPVGDVQVPKNKKGRYMYRLINAIMLTTIIACSAAITTKKPLLNALAQVPVQALECDGRTSLLGKTAPLFKAECVMKGAIKPFDLAQVKSRFKVLFFYPNDFSMVCPTELRALETHIQEFKAKNADIIGISVDSVYVHKAWLETPEEAAGIKGVTFPLVSDITHAISKAYGVLDASGVSQRAIIILDEKNIVQYVSINNVGFGRSIEELLRVIDAITFTLENKGDVCPMDWEAGKDAMKATPEGAQAYFKAHAE